MKISAVCFDLGKVLIDFDWNICLRRIAEKSPHAPEEIAARMKQDGQFLVYEIGKITSSDFFAQLKNTLDYEDSALELRSAFSEIFTPLSDHIALAAALSKHYPLAIISNTNEAHIHQATSSYSFFSFFHALIYSHEVHVMKPDAAIYHAALAALAVATGEKIDPTETLFIDDLEPNILGAVQLGWQTIHLRPDVNLREALASYELKGLD